MPAASPVVEAPESLPSTDPNCLFCKIGSGELRGTILDRDAELFVLQDIHPQAPVHQLIIPFAHIPSVAHVASAQSGLLGRMAAKANELAKHAGVAEKGYRLIINCGQEGGQSVGHLHMHLLAGRQLRGELG